MTDICAKLRDAKPSDGPLVDMLAVVCGRRAATAAATNFPGPAMVEATLYSVYDELLMQAGPGLSWRRAGFSDNVQRTQRAVEACELEAAASVCCRRNDDRDAAEDYLASLTARAALVENMVRGTETSRWRPFACPCGKVPPHETGHVPSAEERRCLVEAACLLREDGRHRPSDVNGVDGERLSETTSQAIPRTG